MPTIQDQLQIGAARLRNRLVLPPLTTGYADTEGYVTERILGFYRQRARHVGLAIVEAAAVRADGRIIARSLGAWSDEHVTGLAGLAGAIKAEGAAAFLQISHAGARSFPIVEGLRAAAASEVAFRTDIVPTPLDREQIEELVACYAAAARRAQSAGFDGVEVHGAHFYLLSQFLSPLVNRRDDVYGGNAAGRATFAAQIVNACRQATGEDFAVICRLNGYENLAGGQTVDEAAAAAQVLAQAGADAIHVSTMSQLSWRDVDGTTLLQGSSALAKDTPRQANLPYAARIKQSVSVPVIAVGKLGESAVANQALASGAADAIAVGRQMIADPDAAGKMLAGQDAEIKQCDQCMACFASIQQPTGLRCKVNADPAN
ncbi:MAG: oxidoreductase [Chloroflexota bacterium]